MAIVKNTIQRLRTTHKATELIEIYLLKSICLLKLVSKV